MLRGRENGSDPDEELRFAVYIRPRPLARIHGLYSLPGLNRRFVLVLVIVRPQA